MICSSGIVLNSIRYTDDKVIVNVYTAVAGGMAFVVRRNGVRSARSVRQSAAMWQPLTLVELTWDDTHRGSLAVAREITIVRPWVDIPFHPHKAAMALFLGEFLGHVLRHEPANAELTAFAERSLEWFDNAESGFASFHVTLLLGLSRYLGFEPNTEDWHEGWFFDLRAAEFCESRPTHPDYIEGSEAALVPRLLRLGYGQMRRVKLNGLARSRMLEVIVWFYRLHVPDLPDMKSLAVLRDTFR